MFLGVILLAACMDDKQLENPKISFTYELFGLEGRIIREMKISNDKLIAATDNGIYSSPVGSENWMLIGLASRSMKAIEIISENHWMATLWSPDDPSIFQTLDAGKNWELLTSNFGGEYNQPPLDLEYVNEEGILYGSSSYVIAESNDLGVSWNPVVGGWDMLSSGLDFVEKNPYKNDIWAGGQNAIEGFILVKYNRDSKNSTVYIDQFEPPSSGKVILFDSRNPDRILVGAEGGIIKSNDNGESWELTKDDSETYKFTFGLIRDNIYPDLIYSGGWIKSFDDPQPLIISLSKDNGESWEDVLLKETNIYGGILAMTAHQKEKSLTLYLGTYKGGVIKVDVIK